MPCSSNDSEEAKSTTSRNSNTFFKAETPIHVGVKELFTKNHADSNGFSKECLILVNCSLNEIPKTSSLKTLSLMGCQSVIPYDESSPLLSNIFSTLSLTHLSLTGMGIKYLPAELEKLENLEYLNLSRNSLTEIAQWLQSLKKLQYLFANSNCIQTLPEIWPLRLKVIKLQRNKLRKLPLFLGQLGGLKLLKLSGNPLVFPDLSIVKNGTRVICEYLKQFMDDTVQNESIKVVIVGEEKAGKTSLVKALNQSSLIIPVQSDGIEKTEGLEISELKLDKLTLKVFDLAGDIDFLETHSMFVSEGSIYLAVFDLSKFTIGKFTNNFLGRLEVWLTSIFSQAPSSPVIIVGTHADSEMITPPVLDAIWCKLVQLLESAKSHHIQYFADSINHRCLLCHSQTLERQSINGVAGYVAVNETIDNQMNKCLPTDEQEGQSKKGFPHILGYYEVSNIKQIPRKVFRLKNQSIEQLLNAVSLLSRDILSLDPVIPRKWLEVGEAVIKRMSYGDPCVPLSAVIEAAYNAGFTQRNEFLSFLRHKHSKGELLFYEDIEELKDTIILDPQWLSDQLRTLITYRRSQSFIADGILKHDTLDAAWNHIDEENRNKLLHLFRRAGICFSLGVDTELFPCRLPVGRPDEDIWPSIPDPQENQLNIFITLSTLPPSFFSDLIVLVNKKRNLYAGRNCYLYYSNHIVYITRSQGESCDFHTLPNSEINSKTVVSNGTLTADNCRHLLQLKEDHRKSFESVESFSSVDNFSMDKNNICVEDVLPRNDRHRVHFELVPHQSSIQIVIRGKRPCCLVSETLDMIGYVKTTKYPGLERDNYILCPICVLKGHHKPAKFLMHHGTLETDPVCDKGHDLIDWQTVLMGKCSWRPSVTSEGLIQNLHDTECPKLFAVLPINLESVQLREFLVLSYLREGFAVHLLCEYPEAWHFMKTPGYRLSKPKEFMEKYGKRVYKILKMLSSLEQPLRIAANAVGPAETAAEVANYMGRMSLELEKYLDDFTENYPDLVSNDDFKNDINYLKSAEGLQRSELRRFLNKADEGKRFGSLIPTFVKGQVLWLCEEHHKHEKTIN